MNHEPNPRAAPGGNGGPRFDDVVRDNMDRGLLIVMKETIVEALRDPRLERRHLRVLAEIIDCINSSSGTAYPGRKAIADRTLAYIPDEHKGQYGYTEAGVGKTISELVKLGYLVSTKRAAAEGGRAVAHYTIRRPSREDLEREIGAFVAAQRLRPDRRWQETKQADVTCVGNVSDTPDRTSGGNVRPSDVTHAGNVRAQEPDRTSAGNVRPELPAVVTSGGNLSPPDVTSGRNVTCVGNVTSDVTYGGQTVTRDSKLGDSEGSARASANMRDGERDAGHGVFVNGSTIRHAAFVISLPAIQLGTVASGLTMRELTERCLGHALQWAAEIENGARADKVVPSKVANFLMRSIMNDTAQAAVQSVRMQKAREGYGNGPASATSPAAKTQSESLREAFAQLAREQSSK